MKKHEMLALVVSAALFGVVTLFLLTAVSGISGVVDQMTGLRPIPPITEWAFNFRPKDGMALLSIVLAVVATYLFVGYKLIVTERGASSSVFCFSVMSCFWLLGAGYFLFFLYATAMSQIVIIQHLYAPNEPHPPTHFTEPMVDGYIWMALAVVYVLALLVIVVRTRRKARKQSRAGLGEGL